MGSFYRLPAPTLLGALLLSGCGVSEGGDTPTGELSPDFRVIANQTTTSVFGRLQSADLPSIRLPDGDELRVATGLQDKRMAFATDPVNGGFYTTSLTRPGVDEVITFSLTRSGAANAPDSRVTMPPPVQITAPTTDAIVEAGTSLQVSWSPSGTADGITIVLGTTECTNGGGTSPISTPVTGDPGTATIVVPSSILPINLPSTGTCAVSVRVERTRFGSPDPAFDPGGIVLARQIDFRRIFVIPED